MTVVMELRPLDEILADCDALVAREQRWAGCVAFIRDAMASERATGGPISDGALRAYWAVLHHLGANTPEDDKGVIA